MIMLRHFADTFMAQVYSVMKHRTNVGLRLRHGKQERVFRAQFISNSPFTGEK